MTQWKKISLVLVVLFFPISLESRSSAWAADLKEAVEELAVRIARGAPEGRTLRIAVTDFPDLEGVTSNLGRYIAERLTTRLSADVLKFRVIERRRLTQVLRELGFSMSGLVDPNKAKELGKMLGVEALIVGTVSDLGNIVDVDARIIEIETNRMLPGVTVTVSKDNVVREMMERGRVLPASATGIAPSGASPISLGTAKYQEFPKFRVEVEGLKVGRGGTVTLFLAYTNKTQQELLIGRYRDTHPFKDRNKIYLIDSAGNRYDFIASSGMDNVQYRDRSPLSLGPSMRSTASFSFQRQGSMEKMGRTFSFTSEQVIVKRTVNRFNVIEYHPASTHNISIRDIEPR